MESVVILSSRRLLAPVVAALSAALVVVLGWRGVDWPAQVYRVELFRNYGWIGFDAGWFGGHYPLAYSVVFPPLAALVGVDVVAVASAVVAAWAFDRLVGDHFGPRATVGSLCFAIGTAVQVAIGQLPFLLGVALALLAVLAYRSHRPWLAAVVAVACALTSPEAAAFLALAALARATTVGRGLRSRAVLFGAAATLPILLVVALYRQTGRFPFRVSALACVLAACVAALVILPAGERALRRGAVIYGLAAVVLFVIPNPVGGNMTRLGAVVGAPLLACSATSRRRLMTAAAVPLVVWQWSPAFGAVAGSQQVTQRQADYFAPLLVELQQLQVAPARLEIPPTQDHWETAWVAPTIPLARGWDRQLDTVDNPMFYEPDTLNASVYRSWLYDNGVTLVAMPSVQLDYSAEEEATLIRSGLSYLQPIWHNADWQLWQVTGAPGLVSGPARLTSLGPNEFSVDATTPGDIVVRVRYTPMWKVDSESACLSPTSDGWTRVRASRPGTLLVSASLLPHRQVAC